MATGTGKTVVMAMLIAWQTVNKVYTPSDARFAKRFLVVTPGITIRDRLGVLQPEREDNYYRERDLVPPDLWEAVLQAQVEIVNYHAFLPQDAKEIQGVAGTTRKLLAGPAGKTGRRVRGDAEQIAARVLRRLRQAARARSSCSTTRPTTATRTSCSSTRTRTPRRRTRIATARRACGSAASTTFAARIGIKTVYDLSATPYYLKGSGYNEGFIFPWVVSDFSLMDAIESGIVKVPRDPGRRRRAGRRVTYRDLWDHIGPPLPKEAARRTSAADGMGRRPSALEGALRSLYRSYERITLLRGGAGRSASRRPVLIVVCPNTIVSKLVFDWIAGREVEKARRHGRSSPGQPRRCSATWTTAPGPRASARSWSTRPSSSPASP